MLNIISNQEKIMKGGTGMYYYETIGRESDRYHKLNAYCKAEGIDVLHLISQINSSDKKGIR